MGAVNCAFVTHEGIDNFISLNINQLGDIKHCRSQDQALFQESAYLFNMRIFHGHDLFSRRLDCSHRLGISVFQNLEF